MAKTTTTKQNESVTINADELVKDLNSQELKALQSLIKSGLLSQATVAAKRYQIACSTYGALAPTIRKTVGSSFNMKNLLHREVTEGDCSHLSKDEQKRFRDAQTIKKAWKALTDSF